MPVFENDALFKKWWSTFPHDVNSFSREGIAYEAWKAAMQCRNATINSLPESIIAREEFMDNFNG